jgi:hypothetical protein
MSVDETALLRYLEELADQLSVAVRYELLEEEGAGSPGGLCRIKDQHVVIVNSTAPLPAKVEVLARALTHFDLSGVYLKPVLREYLEGLKTDENKAP